MKQHAQFSDLLLRMISQVFHEGRLFRNCHNHVHSPPHSAYRYPHQLRRKKPGKVSWEATSFKECFGAPGAIFAKISNLPTFLREKGYCRVVQIGSQAGSTFNFTLYFDAPNGQAIP
jgi:hypothetical protein